MKWAWLSQITSIPLGHYPQMIITGVLVGMVGRLMMLRTDYRQYPTFPHGRIIHIALGVIASALGAIAVPSLLKQDFTAITFLTVAAQQFRDVRNMERQMLSNVDQTELVPRGLAYIEGIAMAFEGRNYLVIAIAFCSSFACNWTGPVGGVLIGGLIMFLLMRFASGITIDHIADVAAASIRFEGPLLYVDDVVIMNIGLKKSRELILEHGIGILIRPQNADGSTTLSQLGQRQSIQHDLATILGVYRDSGNPSLVPLAKRDLHTGNVAVFALPMEKNMDKAIEIVRRSPVLENAVRKPLSGVIKPKRHRA
ncbi:MAG: hypothetical protein JWN30_12 [Bacilli bacterium]|nr:hypothetical protein [Bacilli bacterium]